MENDKDGSGGNKYEFGNDISSVIQLEEIGSYFGKGLNLVCNKVKSKCELRVLTKWLG